MWLARKKTKFVDGKEIYGKTFNQSEISSVARFLNFRNDQILLETVKLVGFFGRLLEILPPPPTCQCAAPRPTWSGPAHLPPASLSPKNKTRKVYYFTKEKKKGLLLLTPIFSLISSSSNGYSCYIIFPLVSINGILLPKLFWPTVRKNCSSNLEKLLKFEAELLGSLFKQSKVRTIFGNNMLF